MDLVQLLKSSLPTWFPEPLLLLASRKLKLNVDGVAEAFFMMTMTVISHVFSSLTFIQTWLRLLLYICTAMPSRNGLVIESDSMVTLAWIRIDVIEFSHVCREANSMADFFAKKGVTCVGVIWFPIWVLFFSDGVFQFPLLFHPFDI